MSTPTTPEGGGWIPDGAPIYTPDPSAVDRRGAATRPNPPTGEEMSRIAEDEPIMCQSEGDLVVAFYYVSRPTRPWALTFANRTMLMSARERVGWREGEILSAEGAALLAQLTEMM